MQSEFPSNMVTQGLISERVCPELSIDNAQVLPSGDVTEGNTVTVRCLQPKHYVLFGNNEVTCQSSGWGNKPACRRCGESKFYLLYWIKQKI